MEEGGEGVSRSQTRLTSKGGVRSLEDRVETVEILGPGLSLIKIYSPKHACNAKWQQGINLQTYSYRCPILDPNNKNLQKSLGVLLACLGAHNCDQVK